jgi:hypothetical protein
MNVLFVFSSEIPNDFAVAILYIVTERSTLSTWDIVRKFWFENPLKTESWVKSLIEDNKLIHPYDSMGWWKVRIVGH